MKKKKKGIFDGKSKYIIWGTIAFAILGIIVLIVGFGMAYGWMAVLQWFGSRWAIYIYILLGFLGFLVAWVIFKMKVGED